MKTKVWLGVACLGLHSAQEPKLRDTLKGHPAGEGVFCVAYSPDGKTLASGNQDTAIKLWGVATGNQANK